MPYKSDAQRRFLHARHPEIAARWDAEIRRKRKKKIAKGWAKPLGVGVGASLLGGAVANQVPPVERTEWAKERRRRKKAKIKKVLAPASTDPFFNQEAAQKAFDLVMKMDDDTAEMFVHVVASDLLEREVEENRVTLQKHLDEVIAKRLGELKRATLRAVSKRGVAGMESPLPYAQALSVIDSAISKADIPNWEFERKIKRDAASGRFQTKFSDKALDKPMPDKTAKAMGIPGTTGAKYTSLSRKDKARYQHQYLQVANYLRAVNAATDGNNETLVHFKDDSTGETWAEKATSTRPMTTMMDAHVRAIGAESSPTALTAGGVAFSLAGAAGHTMDAGTLERMNAAGGKTEGWQRDWLSEEGGENQNARLYRRTQTLGAAAGALGPPGSKVQLAGKMAEIVGQYGPQAEQVLGPSARKTAYRYRGTEKTPDKRLIDMYGRGIEENKKLGPIDIWGEQEENRLRRARGAGPQPFGSETGVRAKGSTRRVGKPGPAPSLNQLVQQREARAGRAPEWGERERGRAAVSQYLTEKLPSKQYYKLQLASGNTPPSEGVIINSEGQIVTQAVGYGDDHYLPFNLKNLKGLKGGEYIRNRSVGGLTSEDVYTGLISGARRVTVVSRSGTFTMEFQPDFRGGRRHNDKARRMTRRYEQILDAVQSEQVERADVPPRWKKIIEEEVKGEYGAGASPRLVRAEIDARITEFKANPQIDGRDLDRAEADISRFEEQQKRGTVSQQDVGDYRREVMNELRDLKEIKFRLNGVGYTAALDSLREQFPYYINTMARPKEEHLEEFERDLGYVEPARNRPTAASAGWYGTAGKENSRKFSAAHADYQRGLPGAPAPGRKPGTRGPDAVSTSASSTSGASGGSAGGGVRSDRERARDRATEALEQSRAQEGVKSSAVALQQAAKTHPPPTGTPTPEWWDYDENQMREYVDKPENLKKFHNLVSAIGDRWDESNASRQWQSYKNAQGRSGGGTAYSAAHADVWQTSPYKFPDDQREAYRPSPMAGAVDSEIRRIDGSDISLKFGGPLSALDERQLREEFDTSRRVRGAMKTAKMQGSEAQDALGQEFREAGSAFATRFFRDDKGAQEHLENIHRIRHLKAKTGGGGAAGRGGGTWTGRPGQPGQPGQPGGVPARPVVPSGGHLVAVGSATPADDEAARRQIEEHRKGWVSAAHQLTNDPSLSPDDQRNIGVFIAGMEQSRGHPAGFRKHDEWLDDLDPELRNKLEQVLSGARR